MKLYAELPGARIRQLTGDVFIVLWIAGWVWVGRFVHSLVQKLAAPGRLIEGAGSDLAKNAGGVDARVSEVALIGKFLKEPFESLERVGRTLQDAGQDQQSAVQTLALWLGVLLALIPILFALYVWGARRWKWVREASAADTFRTGDQAMRLFALRAIATRPLSELRRATPDPAGAYASGDYASLALLELNELGLRNRALSKMETTST